MLDTLKALLQVFSNYKSVVKNKGFEVNWLAVNPGFSSVWSWVRRLTSLKLGFHVWVREDNSSTYAIPF